MGKHKTNKAAAKRFRRTARGKLKYGRAGKSHLNTGKSRGRKRKLRRIAVMSKSFNDKIASILAK